MDFLNLIVHAACGIFCTSGLGNLILLFGDCNIIRKYPEVSYEEQSFCGVEIQVKMHFLAYRLRSAFCLHILYHINICAHFPLSSSTIVLFHYQNNLFFSKTVCIRGQGSPSYIQSLSKVRY